MSLCNDGCDGREWTGNSLVDDSQTQLPGSKPTMKVRLIPMLLRLQGWRLSVIVAFGTVVAVEVWV